jgi:hypothetical protein
MDPVPRGAGRDIDDAAPLLRAHRRQHGLRAEKGRFQIDRDRQIEIAFGEVVDATDDGDAGIVDEDVNRAERRSDVSNHFCDAGGLRHVGGDGDRAATYILDLPDNCLGIIGTFPIVDRDGDAGFGERDGNRRSDAAGCTGHQGNVAG